MRYVQLILAGDYTPQSVPVGQGAVDATSALCLPDDLMVKTHLILHGHGVDTVRI